MKADAHSDHSLSQILSERDAARAENAELRFEMSQMEAELRFLRGQRFRSVTERVAFQASLFTDEAYIIEVPHISIFERSGMIGPSTHKEVLDGSQYSQKEAQYV